VCNAEYACPFDYDKEERPADKVGKMLAQPQPEQPSDKEATPMDVEKSNKANPIDITEGDDKDPDYVPEVYNKPAKRVFVEDNIEPPSELPEKSHRSNKKTSPNAPRGNKKAAAETKIQQLAKETPIPEVHCCRVFGKTSEKHPHCICLEVDDLEKADNGKLYCPEHFYDGPVFEVNLNDGKKNAAKEKSLKNALAIVEKENEKAALELSRSSKMAALEDYKKQVESSIKLLKSGIGKAIIDICREEVFKKSHNDEDDDSADSNGSTGDNSYSWVKNVFSRLTKR
jgi:hypothetical protein